MRYLSSSFALLLLCSGCIGGSVVQRTYFSLGYPLDRIADRQAPSHDAAILVRRFNAELAYDKQEIVYRDSPYAFGYYTYKLWASKPRKMLQQLVVSHLRRSGVVAELREHLVDSAPDFELEGEIIAIEEVNSTEEQWLARLAMRFTLRRYEGRRAVWSWEFDEQRPVPERSPIFVVKTMSEILESQLASAIEDLDARLTELEKSPDAPTVPKKPVRGPKTPPAVDPKVPVVEPGSHRVR